MAMIFVITETGSEFAEDGEAVTAARTSLPLARTFLEEKGYALSVKWGEGFETWNRFGNSAEITPVDLK